MKAVVGRLEAQAVVPARFERNPPSLRVRVGEKNRLPVIGRTNGLGLLVGRRSRHRGLF
jgi:hypothetical protein